MPSTDTYSLVQKLLNRYQTRDPFRLAKYLGIQVKVLDTLQQQKGFFTVIMNVSFLFINGNLSEEMQQIVCAHELGHALLHRNRCTPGHSRAEKNAAQGNVSKKNQSSLFLEWELFDIKDDTEYEANAFAANLLIDEEEMLSYFADGCDVVQAARALNVNVNLLMIKLIEMQGRGGTPQNLPYIPRRNFLGTISDDAGSL